MSEEKTRRQTNIEAMIGIDPNDQLERLADKLVSERYAMIAQLIKQRKAKGLSVEEVAERMTYTVEDVQSLENGNPVNISVLQMYALSVGAALEYNVVDFAEIDRG